MNIAYLVKMLSKQIYCISKFIEPLANVGVDFFCYIDISNENRFTALSNDVAKAVKLIEHMKDNGYRGLVSPCYIELGDYLVANDQMYDDSISSAMQNQILDALVSCSFISRDASGLKLYVFASKKRIAFENGFPILDLFRKYFANEIQMNKQSFITMDLFEITGLSMYEKSALHVYIKNHNTLNKNLLSTTDLSEEDKMFLVEFVQSDSNKEIALKLNVTERSVYNRIKKIREYFSLNAKEDLRNYLRLNLIV